MKNLFLSFLLLLSFQSMAQQLDSIEYWIDGNSYTAYYALPDSITPETKTVLIVHEWWGLNEYPKMRAQMLAGEGHIGFCVDMYGTHKMAEDPAGAKLLATPFYQDPAMAYAVFLAGYEAALTLKGVNAERMAAIGYCFGGAMVLNAAKSGAKLDAVVSFHGGLSGIPVHGEKLQAAVLVCNGEADGFVPAEDIAALAEQMAESGADYTFINYPESTHAFTNPMSTEVGLKFGIPIAYNKATDEQSWADFKAFLAEKVK
jgi:dienelactone hydrolase